MNIACIGTGFVGVVTSAVLAKLGNQVIGLDIDESKVASLKQGTVPFFEPGLSELLIETQKTGNLSFTTDYKEAISTANIVMIMVGTPSNQDADLKYVTPPPTPRSHQRRHYPFIKVLSRPARAQSSGQRKAKISPLKWPRSPKALKGLLSATPIPIVLSSNESTAPKKFTAPTPSLPT
jgi:hypothetical protein